jgi:hypothetical protein
VRPCPSPQKQLHPRTATAVANVAEGVVGEVGPLSPRPVAAAAEEVLMPGEPATAPQERIALEGTTRVASPKIQEAEEDTGAALLQGATSGGVQALELTCTPWEAASEAGDDATADDEVATRNTLERGLEWVRRVFDELILATTSVSFLVWTTCFFDFPVLPGNMAYSCLVRGRPSRHQVGGGPTRHASFTRSGPNWRCSLSWPGWRQPRRW